MCMLCNLCPVYKYRISATSLFCVKVCVCAPVSVSLDLLDRMAPCEVADRVNIWQTALQLEEQF